VLYGEEHFARLYHAAYCSRPLPDLELYLSATRDYREAAVVDLCSGCG
jgi:hypothetical protein